MTQYVDISGWQSTSVDWSAYKAWSQQGDGRSRVAMKVSEGAGVVDPHYEAFRSAALANGIDEILYYHYARPDLGNTPAQEVDFCARFAGPIRPGDWIMLDLEKVTSTEWVFTWLSLMQQHYPQVALYASLSFVEEHLQDPRLAQWRLILADWTFNPNSRPAAPKPWTSYLALQYTDKATIPGFPEPVDADIFLGPDPITVVSEVDQLKARIAQLEAEIAKAKSDLS